MPVPPRATIASVAAAAGVSKSTAQRALGGSGAVAPQIRERILAAAEALGWRRDPLLAALATRRWAGGRQHPGILVFASGGNHPAYGTTPVWQAVRDTADRLGFPAEAVALRADGSGWRMIAAKRTAGVILSGIVSAEELAPAPWDSLVAVSLGTPVPEIRIHAVDTDPGLGVEMAWKALVQRGCRRIGFVHLAEYRHIHNGERCGRFLWLQDQAPADHQRLPIVHGTFREKNLLQDRIRALVPDGLIGVNDWVHWLLKDDGWRMPSQLQFVSLARDARDSQTAGTNTEDVEQARAGVELLDLLIARRITGLPLNPRTIRVPPTWSDGPTLRPLM